MAMMASPNTLARLTSVVALAITSWRSSAASARRNSCRFSLNRREAFSMMMTEPSTMSPKSMAKRHEIAAGSARPHAEDRREHRERNRRGYDEPRAQAAQEQEEHDDHEDGAQDEVMSRGADGAVHKDTPVIVRLDGNALRQGPGDLRESRFHALGDCASILAHEHQRDAQDHLSVTVHRRGTAPKLRRHGYRAERADGDGRSARSTGHDDVANVVQASHKALGANEDGFAVPLDVPAARVRVVAGERLEYLGKAYANGGHARRIEADFVLLVFATEGVHLDDAGHHSQRDHQIPVEQRLELHQRVILAA